MLTTATNRTTNRDGVHVQVVVRCRPLNAREVSKGVQNVVCCSKKEVSISDKAQNFKKYTFDRVFGSESSQEAVFDEAIRPFVENVLDGFDCTIFAYGQTGTGKTYTMGGESSIESINGELPPEAGIIPRTVKRIFQKLKGSDSTVTVNFLELYNEELTDLLDPWSEQHIDKDGNKKKKKSMKIMEDQMTEPGMKLRRGITLNPCPEDCVVTNEAEILQILERGSAQRQTAETLLNERSSRSHSIFVISIHMKETKSNGEDVIKVGKLNLVDLAGSENVSRAGSNRTEERQREAGNINQSLLTLGRVINALVDKSPHVPYRDSNLTRLLRDSLGGSTKTLMIATISSGESCQEETYKTLDYANRAKSIKNRPEVNQRISKTDLVKDLHAEIKRLKEELVSQRRKEGIIALPLEKHAQNEADRKAMLHELDNVRDQVKDLNDQMMDRNEIVQKLERVKQEAENQLREKQNMLEEQSEKLKDQVYWSETYQKNCLELSAQLQSQSGGMKEAMDALQKHKSILDQLKHQLMENKEISQEVMERIPDQIEQICAYMDQALVDYQSNMQSTFLDEEYRKSKRERQNQKLEQMAEDLSLMQDSVQKELSVLWPKSMDSIEEEIAGCQKQYESLKEMTENTVLIGLAKIEEKAIECQQHYQRVQQNVQRQQEGRKETLKGNKEKFFEQKRKLQDLREEAEKNEEAVLLNFQENVTKVLQETLSRCLDEALPSICEKAKEAMKPERSTLQNCTIMVNDFQNLVGLLEEDQANEDDLFNERLKEEESIQKECQKIRNEALEEIKNHHLTDQSTKSGVESRGKGITMISSLQEMHKKTQQLFKEQVIKLKEEIGDGMNLHVEENTAHDEQKKAVGQLTKTLGMENLQQLANLKDRYLSLLKRFDFEIPEAVDKNPKGIGGGGEDICFHGAMQEEKDPETASSITASSHHSKLSLGAVTAAAKPQDTKENHRTNSNTASTLTQRVMRRAKRGKKMANMEDMALPRSSANGNSHS